MANEKLTLSIVTITYNASQWLERTIRSVAMQQGVAIEYWIIDGGSADDTINIVQRYAGTVTHWISEPDKGLYDAMNKGLQRVTGDYVMFLNAGDSLQAPDTAATILRVAQEHACPDILYGETDLVDGGQKVVGARRLKAPEQLNWKSFRMGMLVCHQAFIVKRTVAPLYDLQYRFSADFDWCIRCMKKAESIVNTHRRLIYYLNEGLTTANRKVSLKERYRIMQKYYGKLPVFLLHVWFGIRFYWAKLTRQVV